MTSAWGRQSFFVVLLTLAILTFVGVVGLRSLGAGVYTLAFLVVPIGAGGWYLYENRENPPIDLSRRPEAGLPAPGASPAPSSGEIPAASAPSPSAAETPADVTEPMPSPDEPFDDPVELADRLDSTSGSTPPEDAGGEEKPP